MGLKIEDIETLKKEWNKTLHHFGITRKIFPFDESNLGRFLRKYGLECCRLAMIGARCDKKNEDYNPADYLRLTNVFDEQKIERYVNMGAAAVERYKREQKHEKIKEEEEVLQEEAVPCPPEFKEKLAKLGIVSN